MGRKSSDLAAGLVAYGVLSAVGPMSPPVQTGARPRPNVPHRTRPEHDRRHPVQVTLRALPTAPPFRRQRTYEIIRTVFAQASVGGFRVIHFSVQHDHIHLIVEAEEKAHLSSHLRSLIIRIAKRLNRVLGRAGRLWADRYHRCDLTSPRAVRRALVYVMCNFKNHVHRPFLDAFDVFSSAFWFKRWRRPFGLPARFLDDGTGPPVVDAETWLLSYGWQILGRPIDVDDTPRCPALSPFRPGGVLATTP